MSKPQVQLSTLKQVYFLGIGGIGMSAIARWFLHQGIPVAGYDRTESPLTQQLSEEGMVIHYEDDVRKIPQPCLEHSEDCLFIFTPAIPSDHIEKNYLLDRGIPLWKRAQILGWLTEQMPTLAIAGTHGKTTTSAMLTHILKHAEKNVCAFLGGITQNYQSNFVPNQGMEDAWAVVEADEYDRSFLTLYPKAAAITSTDADHLDIYGAADAVKTSFQLFAQQIQADGFMVQKAGLGLESACSQSDFGIDMGAYRALNIRIENHRMVFDLEYPGGSIPQIPMRIPGYHNIENALAAAALAFWVGLSPEEIKSGIAGFLGVKRRFEYHLETEAHVFIDDYAHHPTEIEACLRSVKALYPDRSLTVVFQPHLFSRTRDFLPGFAESLSLADRIYLLDIYPARELPIPGVHSSVLLEAITKKNKALVSKEGLLECLEEEQPELLVCLGAGDIDLLLEPIKKVLILK